MPSSNGPLRVGIGGPVGLRARRRSWTRFVRRCAAPMRLPRSPMTSTPSGTRNFSSARVRLMRSQLSVSKPVVARTRQFERMRPINLAAVADMCAKFPSLDLILIESGGDNLAATFSPELADITIYVIDVAAGDKIPSKGGPGALRSDLLVINKIDLAPYVGASLSKMETDAKKMRGERPLIMTNLRRREGLQSVVDFIQSKGGVSARTT